MFRPIVARPKAPNITKAITSMSESAKVTKRRRLTVDTPLEPSDLVLLALFDGPVKRRDGLAIRVASVKAVESAPCREKLGLEGIGGSPGKGSFVVHLWRANWRGWWGSEVETTGNALYDRRGRRSAETWSTASSCLLSLRK